MDPSLEPRPQLTTQPASDSLEEDQSMPGGVGSYQVVNRLLAQEPFLLYVGETDDQYIVRHKDELDLQVRKDRARPEPYPARRTILIRKAYRWLGLAMVGLLFAGLGAMVFAMLAGVAALSLNFQSISRADRVRSLVVLILSGALWLGGLLLGAIMLLHFL